MVKRAVPCKEVPEEAPKPMFTVKKKPTKTTAHVQDLSHIFMLSTFAKFLGKRVTTISNLAENFKKYANSKELMDRRNTKFPTRN